MQKRKRKRKKNKKKKTGPVAVYLVSLVSLCP
jgi:hypothetical protein